MITTGMHGWLIAAAGCYSAAWVLRVLGRQRAGLAALLAAFVLQGAYLIGRGWLGGVFIPNPVVQGPFFLPWCLGLITVVLATGKPSVGTSAVLALAAAFTLISVFYAKGMIPPTPKKISVWALLFFMSESMAHALFYTASLYAVLTLAGRTGTNEIHPWLVWGFIAYTVAQVTGAVWSFIGWGNTFSWGSRHLGSAAIWTFFAAALHLQFIPKWKRMSPYWIFTGGMMVFAISYGHYFQEMRFLRLGG